MIWTEGRQPDCYGCHCSYLITDSDNQNSHSLMCISYDDMNTAHILLPTVIEGRQPDCYGCHCSYLITDSDNQNSHSLMCISYDDMNRGSSAWLLWLSLLIFYYRQW